MNSGSTETSKSIANTDMSRPMYYRQPHYSHPTHRHTDGNQGHFVSSLRTIYVGKVDYEATPQELQDLFVQCGPIEHIAISHHKATGLPKGHAFIEYKNEPSAVRALGLDQAIFHGRPLKVTAKRIFSKWRG